MKTLKTLAKLVFGIVLGIGIQWVSFALVISFALGMFNSDPVAHLLAGAYTSVGLIISIFCVGFFSWRKDWSIVVGIVLGFVLWILIFGIMLVSPGGAL
jgi:hypothetical protein